MTNKELIAKWYYYISVEGSEPIESDELATIINIDLSLEEFDQWILLNSNNGIEKYDERKTFNKWLDKNDLTEIWNK